MVTHFDEKGKIYTDIIQKQAVWVTLQLPQARLHGTFYIRSNERIKDALDNTIGFVPLTQVEVYSSDGTKLELRTNFMVINKSSIIWLIPDSEIDRED